MKKSSLLFLTFLLVFTVPSPAQMTVAGYQNYTLAGFEVLVEDLAYAQDSALTQEAVDLLETKLQEISQFNIAAWKLDSLMAVPIFMDWNTTNGAAQYHPSRSWLIANGYAPEKARCVEISNIHNFLSWTDQNQPYMVMHELAHAFHHRVHDFNSPVITAAFNNVVSQNLYTNVSYHTGNGNYITQASAYALNNEKEYFAEITEAYFGLNDYFPFDYNDLQTYDSLGFAAAVDIWGDLSVDVEQAALPDREAVLYPNPTAGKVHLAFWEPAFQALPYAILDLAGRGVEDGIIGAGSKRLTVDLSGQPEGMYLLRVWDSGTAHTYKVLKR